MRSACDVSYAPVSRVIRCGPMEREVAALWDEYRETGSQNAFDRLTLHYAPLVKFAQSRLGDGSEEGMRHGLESLRAALETFDGSYQFEQHLFGCVTSQTDVPVW